jgi:structural maintenance of chromosomes protein 6
LDSLIKEGRNQAEVIIHIANGSTADVAYRYSDYGDTIAIERTIRRDGQHSFRVKNSGSGKTIDTRKDEVVAICDHFALLVDNPLVVLSQETSKKFLASSTPKDLYTVPNTINLIFASFS